jgi:hypothetical protein
MARNLKVVHVTTDATTEYKCEKAEPYGACILLVDAKVVSRTNIGGVTEVVENDTPERVFLLSGAVHVYGKMGDAA